MAACTPPLGISTRIEDAQAREILSREASAGSTKPQVQAALDRLRVPAAARGVSEATGGVGREARRPRVLLHRFYESGGWISTDDHLEFLDLSFVFSQDDRLEGTLLYRDKVSYVQGEAVVYPHAPRRHPARHPGISTGGLPPSVDPLEDAR